jgi:hypothetical protein
MQGKSLWASSFHQHSFAALVGFLLQLHLHPFVWGSQRLFDTKRNYARS